MSFFEGVLDQKIVSAGWAGDLPHHTGNACAFVHLEDGTRLNVLPDDAEQMETVIRVRGDSRTIARICEEACELGGTFEILELSDAVSENKINERLKQRADQLRRSAAQYRKERDARYKR